MRVLACTVVAGVLVACGARGGGDARGPEGAEASVEDGACPREMAHVDAYCIDKWEATLVDENDHPYSPYASAEGKKVRAVSRAGVVPQGYVSADDARAACAASRKRLCTE